MGTSSVQFLLDSGAAVSVVRYGALEDRYRQQMTSPNTPTAIAANGAPLELVGQTTIPISIGKFNTSHLFTVALNVTVDCILGIDFLMQHGAVIDCKQKCVMMDGITLPFLGPTSIDDNPEFNLKDNCVKAHKTVVIPGRAIQAIEVALPPAVSSLATQEVLIDQQSASIPRHLLFPRTLNKVTSEGITVIQLVNISPQDVTLYEGTTLGHFTPLQELLTIDTDCPSTTSQPSTTDRVDIDLSSSCLSSAQKQELQQLLSNYSTLFATPGGPLGRTGIVQHTIKTSGAPIRQPMRSSQR